MKSYTESTAQMCNVHKSSKCNIAREWQIITVIWPESDVAVYGNEHLYCCVMFASTHFVYSFIFHHEPTDSINTVSLEV